MFSKLDKILNKMEKKEIIKLIKQYAATEGYKNLNTNILIGGRSGIQHHFDIQLTKHSGRKDKLVMDIFLKEEEIDIKDVLQIFAKLHDAFVQDYELIVYPGLTYEAEKFLNQYNINVLNAKELEGKSELKERFIPTGIKLFDRFIGGGFLKNRIYLLVGNTGTGKTTLGLQFLLQGCRSNEKGLLIMTNQKPEKLIDEFESLDIKLRNYIANDLLYIVDVTRQIEKLKMKVEKRVYCQ